MDVDVVVASREAFFFSQQSRGTNSMDVAVLQEAFFACVNEHSALQLMHGEKHQSNSCSSRYLHSSVNRVQLLHFTSYAHTFLFIYFCWLGGVSQERSQERRTCMYILRTLNATDTYDTFSFCFQ